MLQKQDRTVTFLAGKFNPAFYVSFSPEGEKFLDLPAKMLWFNHAYPGYRIVSDGMDVFTHEIVDASGDRQLKTILLGHVAILDANGVRVISVPCSVSVNSSGGDCAMEFFEAGADLALDNMGMTVYNITSDQWREYWEVKNGWLDEKEGEKEKYSSGGFVKKLFGGGHKTETPSAGTDGDDGYAPSARGAEDIAKMPAVEAMEEVDEEVSGDDVLRMFRDVIVYCPNEVPSYRPGTPVDAEMLGKLFDRFCLSLAGAQWEMAADVERGQIVEKMKSLLSGVRK
jgi:hypothetical protein